MLSKEISGDEETKDNEYMRKGKVRHVVTKNPITLLSMSQLKNSETCSVFIFSNRLRKDIFFDKS